MTRSIALTLYECFYSHASPLELVPLHGDVVLVHLKVHDAVFARYRVDDAPGKVEVIVALLCVPK